MLHIFNYTSRTNYDNTKIKNINKPNFRESGCA